MKYRIKNPKVEKAVCGLFKTQEGFKKYFNASCVNQMDCGFDYIKLIVHKNQSVTGFPVALLIKKSDIEEEVEYDPKDWNEYPKVTPPKEGWYQVHYEVEDVGYVRLVIYWNGKEWETNCPFVGRFAFGFKPWDDEGGK